jgi:uncharacterized protein DUF4236
VALRFRRSIRIAPGVRVNLGLHGAGLSIGSRGLHIGMNRRGMYTSAGIPGTGIYAVHHVRDWHFEPPQQRAYTVAGSGWPVLVVIGLVVLAVVLRACA